MSGVTGTAQATNRMTIPERYSLKSIGRLMTTDWFWALCIVIGAVLIPAPSHNASTVLGLPKLCIFRNITGIPCPGCGMTRSMIAAGHLHFKDAISFHPLGPVVLILLAVYCITGSNLGRKKVQLVYGDALRFMRPLSLVLSGCFLLVWLARILGYLPTPS